MTTFTNLLVSFIFLIASFFILSSSVFAEHPKDHKETMEKKSDRLSEPSKSSASDKHGQTSTTDKVQQKLEDREERISESIPHRDQDRAGKTIEEKRDIDSDGPRADGAENTPIDAPPKVDQNQPATLVNPTDPSGSNVTSPTGKNPEQPMRSNRPSGTDR